jgi:autotransporter-associated beta strand protein
MEFDWNRDGTYGDTSGRFVNGTTNILARNKKAETTTIAASGGGAITLSPASFTTTASAFSKLQILAPGETAAPGTTTGKTGTPTVRTAGVSFNVTVNAVDPYWNLVDTVSDTIAITSTDSAATLPANAPLFAGNGVFAVTLNTPGSFTVTATDVDDPTKTASTTPPLTVLGIPLVWVGDWTLNLWDTTSLNWYDPAFSLVAFTNGNQVTFDDSGSSSPAVNIVGTVMPDTMTVNSASDYVFGSTSGGSIGGTGPLTKQGTGSLTLGTANTFSGITLLSGGTLILNHHLALQNSPLQFTSVTAPLHLGAGITNLVLGGLQKTGSELPINTFITTGYNDLTQLTLNVAAGRTVSYSDIINNTTNIFNGTTNYLKLVKDGPGWQGLTAANGFTGGVEIRNGTLALNTQYGGRIPAVNTLTLGSGANSGVFQLGASTGGLAGPNSQTLAGLATSGTGTSNAVVGGNPVNSTITINNTLDFVYAGSFGGPGVNENNLNVTKSGPGKLTLLGSSTHVGATTVNGGTLLVNNSTGSGTGSGAVTVNGGTLGGTGTIGGALTVNANGTLAPGASIGTLTLAVPPTLNGKVVMELDTTQSPSNDVITVTSGTLTAGGTLIITNLPGSTLALGDSFKLFSAPVAGSFSSIVYPEAPSGTAWTNKLAVDGSVALVASAPTPTNLTFSVSGGDLILDWPAGQGWQLQAQTNALTVGITTNWVTVPGAVPPYTNAVNPANGSVFYRLVYP